MFFRKKKDADIIIKKGAKKFDKLITGVIIGGAVGSVLGATLSDKEKRESIKEKGKEFVVNQKENKKSILNKLINIFRK